MSTQVTSQVAKTFKNYDFRIFGNTRKSKNFSGDICKIKN